MEKQLKKLVTLKKKNSLSDGQMKNYVHVLEAIQEKETELLQLNEAITINLAEQSVIKNEK